MLKGACMRDVRGADVVVRELLLGHGVDTLFMVSGNQVLPLIDAAGTAGVRLVHMRHETAAVYAAIAAAEISGRLSAALVSAGPGFLAALQGIGVARSMELPVLLLSGAAPLSQRGGGAFQDLDQRAVAEAVCKTSVEPASLNDNMIPTLLDAWSSALGSIPGPVHLALPADVLSAPASRREPTTSEQPVAPFDEEVPRRLGEMAEILSKAERPVVLARPSAARHGAGDILQRLAHQVGTRPIVCESPRGLSDPKYSDVVERLPESDCVLCIGPADFAVGFLDESSIGRPKDVLLIDEDGDPAPHRDVHLHVRTGTYQALRYLAGRVSRRTPVAADWAALVTTPAPPAAPDSQVGERLHPLAVSEAARAMLGPEDVVVLDGGEFCQWIRLGLRDIPNRVLWNGKLGAIGGSIPMALGAAATMTAGRVIAILGDGSAGYHLSEFETAARLGLRFVAIVGSDARWAAEWHMQVERYGEERALATDLSYARYDIAAQGYGGDGTLVSDAESLRSALSTALTSERATCINVRVQPVRSPAVVRH
jgi:acetolactate synthase-1/2/3 large subunit